MKLLSSEPIPVRISQSPFILVTGTSFFLLLGQASVCMESINNSRLLRQQKKTRYPRRGAETDLVSWPHLQQNGNLHEKPCHVLFRLLDGLIKAFQCLISMPLPTYRTHHVKFSQRVCGKKTWCRLFRMVCQKLCSSDQTKTPLENALLASIPSLFVLWLETFPRCALPTMYATWLAAHLAPDTPPSNRSYFNLAFTPRNSAATTLWSRLSWERGWLLYDPSLNKSFVELRLCFPNHYTTLSLFCPSLERKGRVSFPTWLLL